MFAQKTWISLLFIFLYGYCNAQKVTTFQKRYGTANNEYGTSIVALPDKGFILAGITGTANPIDTGGVSNILLIRIDSLGRQKWAKIYKSGQTNGLLGSVPFAFVDMVITPDGNIAVYSCTGPGGTGDPALTSAKGYLFKINLQGSLIWSNRYYLGEGSLLNAPGGGFAMIASILYPEPITSPGSIMLKTNDTGAILWFKKYSPPTSGRELSCNITTRRNGGYLMTGIYEDLSFGRRYFFVKEIDENGNLRWTKFYGGAYTPFGYSVLELPDRSIYIVGRAGGAPMLSKLDSSGKVKWTKIYDYVSSGISSEFLSLVFDSTNKTFDISFSATPNSYADIGVIRLDTSGKIIFNKIYGPTPTTDYVSDFFAHDLIHLPTGGFVFLQSTGTQTAGGSDFYFVKTDNNGNTNGCNYSSYPFSITSIQLTATSYANTTTDINVTLSPGCTVSAISILDSFTCAPMVAGFGWDSICLGQTTQFIDSSYYAPISWEWDFGDGNKSNLENPTHKYAKAGLYSVKLVSSNGTNTDSITKTITIYSKVMHINLLDTLVCGNTPFSLRAAGGLYYIWRPDNLVSDSTSAAPNFKLNKSVQFIIQSSAGGNCITFDTVNIVVDNKPFTPKIDYATVKSNSEIDVKFQRSDSNDVKDYEVFRSVNDGAYTILDTINNLSNNDSFYFVKDLAVNAAINKYAYKILVIDSCGAVGDTSTEHQTMGLAVKQLGCTQTLQLNWNPYIGWTAIKNYEIFRSVNGGADSLIATLANNITAYNDTGLNYNNLYCYKILALNKADSFVSQSNTICKRTFFPDIPQVLSASKISTSTTNGTAVIKWGSINKINLAYNLLYFSRDGIHFDTLRFDKLSDRIPIDVDSIVQSGLDTKDSDYYYYLVTVDSCGAHSVKSPTSKTMTLTVNVGELLHKLNWTPYQGFKIKEYQIQRFEKGQFVIVDSVPGTDTASKEFPAPCNYAIRYRIVAVGYDSGEFAWSDTMGRQAIDTFPSDPPVMLNAIVLDGNSAKINFIGSDSLKTYEFVIQRSVDGKWGTAGKILYTKPGDSLQFMDAGFNTIKSHICYTVIALDSCLNASESDTICLVGLTGDGLYCNPKTQLNWIAFIKPPSLPDSLFVFRSINGINYNKISLIPSTSVGYIDTAVTVGVRYYYKIAAVYHKANMSSYSDTLGIIPRLIPDADSAQLVYATVLKSDETKGSIYIQWKRALRNDTNARGYYIYSLNSANGKYALIKDVTDLNDTSYTQNNINTLQDAYKYYIITYNVCDVGINSNIHRTVLLKVENNNLNEQLSWINYLGVPVKSYSVYKSEDGGAQFLVNNASLDSSYLDSNITCNHNYTYQVQAILANGEISFSDSITVKSYDTIKPKTQPIVLATVVRTRLKDGRIELDWSPAIDKELDGYNIYRSIDGLYWSLIIDHWPGTSLIDTGLDTYDQSYYYKIQPVDSCGNIGPFTIYHETIHLKAKADNGYNQLNWNSYAGWKVSKYLVYKNGSLIDTLNNNVFAFRDSAVICNTTYQYLVKAVDSVNDTIISASNTDSAKALNHIPPQKVYIKTVTVSKPNKAATITWTPSKSYDVKNYFIYRKSAITGAMQFIGSTNKTFFIDSSFSKYSGITDPDCYYVFTNDNCSNQSDASNQGCIILLNATNQPGSNELSWNSYKDWRDGVQSYNVYKNEDSLGWQLIGTTSSVQVNEFKDSKLGDSTIDFCYQVEAIENPGQYNQLSRSTVECVHQDATVFVPNTFTPYDQNLENDLFGPIGIHIKNYSMKIYNRWGELVFNTNSGKQWDGRYKGEFVQQGVYIYLITVTDYNGKQSYFKGTITMFE